LTVDGVIVENTDWGLLFLIDVGMSRDVGDSQGAVLKSLTLVQRQFARTVLKPCCGQLVLCQK